MGERPKERAADGTRDASRWVPQPRAAGVTYISAEAKATLDLSESRVHGLADEATWDMATSLGLSVTPNHGSSSANATLSSQSRRTHSRYGLARR